MLDLRKRSLDIFYFEGRRDVVWVGIAGILPQQRCLCPNKVKVSLLTSSFSSSRCQSITKGNGRIKSFHLLLNH